MALLAEQLVQEWLNSQGYLTLRGVRVGYGEIDLLAVRQAGETVERRHIEVQASAAPIGYITVKGAKRVSDTALRRGVAAWVEKKFDRPPIAAMRQRVWRGAWTREVVLYQVRHAEELALIESHGVIVHRLADLAPRIGRGALLRTSHGQDLVELVRLGAI